MKSILRRLASAIDSLVQKKLPEPEFQIGDAVTVILNERNKTPRTGVVRDVVWHYKDSRYNYYLQVDGKKISKRYFAVDLRAPDVEA